MAGPGQGDRQLGNGPLVFGVLLILAGVFWLLSSLGFWFFDWRFTWPLILLAVGAFFVWMSLDTGGGETAIAVPRDDARRLDLRLSMQAGTLILYGGATQLLEAHSTRSDLHAEVRRREGEALVRLRTTRGVRWGADGGPRWDVAAPSDLPIALRLAARAGEFRVDLSAMSIAAASLSLTACQADIVLPRPTGELAVRVSTAASGVTLRVPAGVEALVMATGLVSLDGRRQTPGYAAAHDRVTVTVTGGAAGVTIV